MVEEVPSGFEYYNTDACHPALNMNDANQGVLSCGGVYITRVHEDAPFKKQYQSLHMPNGRQQVILMRNLKPVSITSLNGPNEDFHDIHENVSDELGETIKKFFRDDCN